MSTLLADLLRAAGHDPVVLRGGMAAGQRRGALDRLRPGDGPLLVVATGSVRRRGIRLPRAGHAVPRRADRVQGPARAVRRPGAARRHPASTSPRCTTTTTSTPGCSPRRWASARPATAASASPTRARAGTTRHHVRAERAAAWRTNPQGVGPRARARRSEPFCCSGGTRTAVWLRNAGGVRGCSVHPICMHAM